ncbi:MAG: hypothetical protein FWE84_04810 [Firmicutes bacterium]|nr:hypothetical protein [Bacillota bacterium]
MELGERSVELRRYLINIASCCAQNHYALKFNFNSTLHSPNPTLFKNKERKNEYNAVTPNTNIEKMKSDMFFKPLGGKNDKQKKENLYIGRDGRPACGDRRT